MFDRKPLRAALEAGGFGLGDAAYVRIFKREGRLELWLRATGATRFQLFRTYPVLRYSGELGPKLAEGDLQAPEGFYAVGRDQLNPKSRHHLAFNLGFPNEYDRAHGRSGSFLMVHGGDTSRGCYAMGDAGIDEIYAVVEAALMAGQSRVHVHAFPFVLSDTGLAEQAGHRWAGFWARLKDGSDWFERAGVPPAIALADGDYFLSETPTEPDISPEDRQDHDAVKPRGQPLLAGALMFVVGLVAVAAIASSAWFYSETQRDIRRMSTEIAQLRLSAELYGRRAAPATAVGSTASSEDILNLKNRLAILEDSWRNQTPVAAPGATFSMPAVPASPGKALEDCIPQGTRFLISAGESFAVCKSDEVIRLTSIGMNDVILDSGTSIPTGGSAIMADSNCSVAVFSAGEALSGFAEIRVSC